MFYDSSRIIDKQEKYEKIRAYDVIFCLEKTDLSNENMIETIDLMLSKAELDFHKSIFTKAKNILLTRKEKV
jgi:hypothetical protein